MRPTVGARYRRMLLASGWVWNPACEWNEPAPMCGLTNELTGAGARRAQGTNSGHAFGILLAAVGVHVELTVRFCVFATFLDVMRHVWCKVGG